MTTLPTVTADLLIDAYVLAALAGDTVLAGLGFQGFKGGMGLLGTAVPYATSIYQGGTDTLALSSSSAYVWSQVQYSIKVTDKSNSPLVAGQIANRIWTLVELRRPPVADGPGVQSMVRGRTISMPEFHDNIMYANIVQRFSVVVKEAH